MGTFILNQRSRNPRLPRSKQLILDGRFHIFRKYTGEEREDWNSYLKQ